MKERLNGEGFKSPRLRTSSRFESSESEEEEIKPKKKIPIKTASSSESNSSESEEGSKSKLIKKNKWDEILKLLP